LYYDKALSDFAAVASTDTVKSRKKQAASLILASLQEHVGIFLKECRSHVYRAPKNWMHRHKSNEISGMKDRYEGILKIVFDRVTLEPMVSVVVVQLSLVVAMLETEKFESSSYYDATETKDHRGPLEHAAEERMLQQVDLFIREESQKLQIESLENVRAQICDSEMKRNHILLYDSVVEQAKVLMKGQCCSYLQSISVSNNSASKMIGTIQCSVTYSRSSVGNTFKMEPWREGGFSVTTELPHNGLDGIKNPLYSPTVAKYLKQTWMGKFSLWTRGVVDLIETAMDMQIEANNQFCEGLFKNAKHNQDVYDHVSDAGKYILHRYNDSNKSAKQFIHQYETVYGKIQELMTRRAKRRRNDCEGVSAGHIASHQMIVENNGGLTQDELTQQDQEEASEIWGRGAKGGSRLESEANLRQEVADSLKESIGNMNYSKWHQHLQDVIGAGHISYPTFKAFMENKHVSKRGLSEKHRAALQEFLGRRQEIQQAEPVASEPVES
jgi:hypothetical protein